VLTGLIAGGEGRLEPLAALITDYSLSRDGITIDNTGFFGQLLGECW